VKVALFLSLFLSCFAAGAATQTAVFAGGCFWCMQPPYDALKSKGVLSTKVGYTGGSKANPTYAEVSAGETGHYEAIEVTYDSDKITYDELLDVFWKNIDPFDVRGQFCDKGQQYKSAIFIQNDEQKKKAQESKEKIEKSKKEKVATLILPAGKFYPAEEYHQSYYEKNPLRYKFYRFNCGRDQRLKEVWGESPH
jgi:peptide-methionine (S)-S-oxide reductase